MLNVTRSTKGPEGWAQARMAPAESKAWDAFDREWIQWMIDNGQDYVKIGETMYTMQAIELEA